MSDETAQGETQGPLIQWDINKAAIAEMAEDLKDIDAYKDLDAAKAAKRKLIGMRTELTEYHKDTKAKALAFGKECDSKKNEYMALIREIEDPISTQLDEIKNAGAIKEQARVAKIMAEIERIQAYALDRHSLTLEELEERLTNLRDQVLSVELLEEYSEDAQLAKDEADLKLRLAIDREKTEQKDREEKAELARKNEELQAELEESRKANEERDRKRREYDAEQDRVIKEAADKRQDEDNERLAKEQDEINKQKRELDEEKKRIADEEADRLQKEQDKLAEAEAAELTALQAPDVDKLTKYAEAIEALIKAKPVMGSHTGAAILLEVIAKMIDGSDYIKNNIEELK